MIDPKTVLLSIPSYTGSVTSELNGMLMNYGHGFFGGVTQPTECSHPSLVRNIIADTFLRSPFEWLVGIDSDIVPSSEDFEYLMQEVVPNANYFVDGDGDGDCDPGAPPLPSRIEAATVVLEATDQGNQRQVSDRALCDVLVNCEYAYKREPFEPVHFGLGFYRVHRSVFSILQDLKHGPSDKVEVSRQVVKAFPNIVLPAKPTLDSAVDAAYRLTQWAECVLKSVRDPAGQPRLWQATHQGRVMTDYYPSGPIVDLHVPNGKWMGEDHGFWTLCHLAGLVPRIETRTRLIHVGRKGYPYDGPDVLAALQ